MRNTCDKGHAAGVVCIDNSELKLHRSPAENPRAGNIQIGYYSVCDNHWSKSEAQVVCNQLFKSSFEYSTNVPVYAVYQGSHFGVDSGQSDVAVMDQVQCKGDESLLTDCQFLTVDEWQCSKTKLAGVACAKCTINDLLSILDIVQLGDTTAEVIKTIDQALDALASKCLPWDCSSENPNYPEYCMLRSFLESSKSYVSIDTTAPMRVSLLFDQAALLDHEFVKEETTALFNKIEHLEEQSADFQTKLAGYFKTLAEFDRDKAKADYSYTSATWVKQINIIRDAEKALAADLPDLLEAAIKVEGKEKEFARSQLALSIASLGSPMEILFNPGEEAENMGNVQADVGQLANEIAESAKLGFTLHNTLEQLSDLAADMNAKYAANASVYDDIADTLGINDMGEFTPEQATEFLDQYNNFQPFITSPQLALYEELLEEIVNNACDVLQGDTAGTESGFLRIHFQAMCPDVMQKVAVLTATLEDQKEMQFEVMDAFADFARAKLAESAAIELSKVLGESSLEKMQAAIAKKNAASTEDDLDQQCV